MRDSTQIRISCSRTRFRAGKAASFLLVEFNEKIVLFFLFLSPPSFYLLSPGERTVFFDPLPTFLQLYFYTIENVTIASRDQVTPPAFLGLSTDDELMAAVHRISEVKPDFSKWNHTLGAIDPKEFSVFMFTLAILMMLSAAIVRQLVTMVRKRRQRGSSAGVEGDKGGGSGGGGDAGRKTSKGEQQQGQQERTARGLSPPSIEISVV